MTEPAEVDRIFYELINRLEDTPSIRYRLQLIDEFMDLTLGEAEMYESYLIQLAGQFPAFSGPLTYSGLDPDVLLGLHDKISRISSHIPEFAEETALIRCVAILRRAAMLNTLFTGNTEGTINLFKKWYTPEDVPDEKKFPDSYGEHLNDLRARLKHFMKWLEWTKESMESSGHRTTVVIFEIKQILSDVKMCLEEYSCSLLIPVLEETRNIDTRVLRSFGRLRRLRISNVRKLDQTYEGAESDVIMRRFITFGTEKPHLIDASDISKAARSLFDEFSKKKPEGFYRGDLEYEMTGTYHTGNSYHAAVTALWFCSLQKKENFRERYELFSEISITGDIDSVGSVKPVAEESIKAKTEAVFFSWSEQLVVPKEQESRFLECLSELKKKYPNRELRISGIDHLTDLFYDRRLTRHINPSRVTYFSKRAWDKKFETAGMATILVLLIFVFRLLHGPVDQNPVMGEFQGEVLDIKNQSGRSLEKINVGASTVNRSEINGFQAFVTFYDTQDKGRNDIYWGEIYTSDGRSNRSGYIKRKGLKKKELEWSVPLQYELDFPRKPEVIEDTFLPAKIRIVVSESSDEFLVTTLDHAHYFPGIISIMDPESGRELSHFLNIGRIRDFVVTDLNKNGKQQIIFCGVNNAFDMAFLAILDLDKVYGLSPSTEEYQVNHYSINDDIQYVLIPKTYVGECIPTHWPYNLAQSINLYEDEGIIQVDVYDYNQYRGASVQLPSSRSYLYYYFNYDLSLQGVGTSDGYDLTAQYLYDEGIIDTLPDYRYFENYQERLLYWDGGEFIRKAGY